MKIGIIGSGRIGGNIGRRAAEAGHEVVFSFARDQATLDALAADVGHASRSGTPAEAAQAEIVVLSTPWNVIDDALGKAGPLNGKIVIDTTNPYLPSGFFELPAGQTSGLYNQARTPGARLVKAFNTFTSGFQADAARDPGKTAMFYGGGDAAAKRAAEALARAVGLEPVDLGPLADAGIMDAPRRAGSVYGEAYTPDAARAIATALRSDPDRAARLADETHASE